MSSILTHSLAQVLAWSLVHFVWQGAAIALAAFAVMRIGRLSASARYITGVVAMAAMLVAPAITFARLSAVRPLPVAPLSRGAAAPAAEAPGTQYPVPGTESAPSTQHPALGTQAVPSSSLAPTVVLLLWCAGVVILSLRLIGGWFVAHRMARRATSPATPEIQALARKIAGRLALDRIVGVYESAAVSVPVMIGWMKPVVLLPAAALSGLSIVQVEALLAHELAHVRRHDYLVNLLQSVVETLLFYHPAVWWVSGRMRVDRELCCDDVAIEVCDRIVYATALSDLAAMAATPRMALAATDGPLLNRVRRILGQHVDRQDSGSGWLSALLVVLLVGSIAPSALTSSTDPRSAGLSDLSRVEGQPGVTGSVQPGVTAGVQSGVAGGVSSGIAGGVTSGVAGGVTSGVAGGVQRPDSREQVVEVEPQSGQTEEARKAAQAAEARARDIEAQRHALELERIANEFRHTTDQSQARLASLEDEIKRLMLQLNRSRQLVEKGLVSSTDQVELEAQIAKVQRSMTLEKDELAYQQENFQLKRRAVELERQASVERLPIAVDSLVAEKERVVAEKALQENVVNAEGAAKAKVARERLMNTIADESAALGSSEVARAGDVVNIVIHNEPDLPKTFIVQADGTIRFPFVGAIRVQGLTAAQTRDALGKLLSDRKLAAGSGIEVTLRRPRTPGSNR